MTKIRNFGKLTGNVVRVNKLDKVAYITIVNKLTETGEKEFIELKQFPKPDKSFGVLNYLAKGKEIEVDYELMGDYENSMQLNVKKINLKPNKTEKESLENKLVANVLSKKTIGDEIKITVDTEVFTKEFTMPKTKENKELTKNIKKGKTIEINYNIVTKKLENNYTVNDLIIKDIKECK